MTDEKSTKDDGQSKGPLVSAVMRSLVGSLQRASHDFSQPGTFGGLIEMAQMFIEEMPDAAADEITETVIAEFVHRRLGAGLDQSLIALEIGFLSAILPRECAVLLGEVLTKGARAEQSPSRTEFPS